jgi:hypothetical protein
LCKRDDPDVKHGRAGWLCERGDAVRYEKLWPLVLA